MLAASRFAAAASLRRLRAGTSLVRARRIRALRGHRRGVARRGAQHLRRDPSQRAHAQLGARLLRRRRGGWTGADDRRADGAPSVAARLLDRRAGTTRARAVLRRDAALLASRHGRRIRARREGRVGPRDARAARGVAGHGCVLPRRRHRALRRRVGLQLPHRGARRLGRRGRNLGDALLERADGGTRGLRSRREPRADRHPGARGARRDRRGLRRSWRSTRSR